MRASAYVGMGGTRHLEYLRRPESLLAADLCGIK
jgi:hypothetical protein